jgi:hypothetical protein
MGTGEKQMIQPLSLDVVLEEFSEKYKAWVIQGKNGKYLVIPDNRFPGRRPIRFFMSKLDAARVVDAVLQVKPELKAQKLVATEVNLRQALRGVAADNDPSHADSFVVHSPNEVYEFVSQLKPPTIN